MDAGVTANRKTSFEINYSVSRINEVYVCVIFSIKYQYLLKKLKLLYKRDDQKVFSPIYFGLPGNEKLTSTFQYNLPSCPFKIEGFYWSLKYPFTALLPYCVPQRLDFSFGNK